MYPHIEAEKAQRGNVSGACQLLEISGSAYYLPMRVFVLCTGRCGSTTFVRACEHLTNYTAKHESRARRLGDDRFNYPDRHIEADNRLAWFLAGLGRRFGGDPLYVHLRRDPEAVASSFVARWDSSYPASMIRAFGHGLLMRKQPWDVSERIEVARFFVSTVTANIEWFLRDKPNQLTVWIENANNWFPGLWDRIGGTGDFNRAMAEFGVRHNAARNPDL